MPKQKLDDFHYHEVCDRTTMIMDAIEHNLMSHPAVSKKMRKRLIKAQLLLGEVYQEAGLKY